MRLRLLAAVILLTGSLFAADPQLLSLAMPDSQVMAGVNFEQVVLSPLGQYLLAENGRLPNPGFTVLTEAAGFDPRWDLREILVSWNGKKGNGPGIMLARGTFNVQKIVETFQAGGGTVETYKGVSIIGKSQDAWAFPDATLAIMGDAENLRAAIDRLTAPTSISSALAVQVNQLSTTEDAWFVSIMPPALLEPWRTGQTGAAPDPFAMLGKVQQASGGVEFGANVVVTLQSVAQTEQDAAALAALLKSLPAMAQMNAPKGELASAITMLQSLNVTVEGPIVKVSLSIPESQIEQAMQAAHASPAPLESAPRPHSQPMQRAVPPPPVPSSGEAPQRIRVGAKVEQAKLIQHPEPAYPPLAKQARIAGVVHLNAIIGKDGTVQDLTITSGHPLLVPAALEAVKQWVYEPTLLNGKAVEVVTPIEVNFTLAE
jgi:TonB family protein